MTGILKKKERPDIRRKCHAYYSSRDWSKIVYSPEIKDCWEPTETSKRQESTFPRQREREEEKGKGEWWGRTLKHTMHDPVKTFNFSQTLVGWRTVKEQEFLLL